MSSCWFDARCFRLLLYIYFKSKVQKLSYMLVTLRRYCVHSTLVPAIVPRFFFPHERGKSEDPNDWRKFCIHRCVRCFFCKIPRHSLTKTLFCLLCVCFSFLGFGWAGVGGVLQCSTSPIRCRIGQSSLFPVLPLLCVTAVSHF